MEPGHNCNNDWDEAKVTCESYGASLARVVSREANEAILSTFDDAISSEVYQGNTYRIRFWIGLERVSPYSDDWDWTNGERLGSFSYWGTNKPSYYGDCVRYLYLMWDDQDCWDDWTAGTLCMRGDPVPSRKKRDAGTNNFSSQRRQHQFISKGRKSYRMSNNKPRQNIKKIPQKKNSTSLENQDRSLIRRKKNVYYDYGVPRPKRNVDNLVTREINCVPIWDGIAGVWSYPYTVPEYCFSKDS